MTKYKIVVSTPQQRGRWRIARQWWPEPQEAEVTAEELERLEADPLLKVVVNGEMEVGEPDDRSSKKLVGWPASGALAKAGLETRGQLEAYLADGKALTAIEGIDEEKAKAILAKLGK